MNVMIKGILVFIVSVIIFYGLGSFIAASFDITTWNPALRAVIGSLGVIIGGIVGSYIIIEEETF